MGTLLVHNNMSPEDPADAPTRSVEGRTALVTGASAGIGRATALVLAAEGADVALLARSEEKLSTLAAEIESSYPGDALTAECDVRDADRVEEAVETTVDEFGGLDIVVCNAGITGEGFEDRLEQQSIDDHRQVVETNVNGTFYTTHASLPHLREAKGNLIFIGSSAGKLPRPSNPVYAGSKWWMRGFALSVEAHAGRDGVAVTLINPTAVRTDMWRDQLNKGQAAEPGEVAAQVINAAEQPSHSTLSEIDLFRRDMLGTFLPGELDLTVSFDHRSSEQ